MQNLNPNQRIYDVLLAIHRGAYRIPNIQRGYEWDKGRITKLLDSVMNGYPIGAIMVWKPTPEVQKDISDRNFIRDFRSDEDYLSDEAHPSDAEAYLVLDGQQRLQSLYLSFFGSYNGSRVFMGVDHVPSPDADDDDYNFQFLTVADAKSRPEMIPLEDIVQLDSDTKGDFVRDLARRLTQTITEEGERRTAIEDTERKITKNVDRFIERFNVHAALLLQEVSSKQTYDHVLEIFERVNSGGMVLSKSDLLFSTLKLKLKEKEKEFRDTLNDINHGSRYAFDSDFIIKTSLVLFGKGAKYDVKKLRDEGYIGALKQHYPTLDRCLRQLIVWLDEVALIKCDRFLPSKSALIPLIDYMFLSGKHDKPDGSDSEAMKQYLHMAFFTRLFGRSGDAILDKIHKEFVLSIKGDGITRPSAGKDFPLEKIKSVIRERTKADYGLHNHFFWADVDLMLNIVQGGQLQIDPTNPTKHSKDLRLEADHIFPRARIYAAGFGDVANHVGNFRLVVLPVNRRKSAKWPDEKTDFFGVDDPQVAKAYSEAREKFSRDTFLAFARTRAALIAKRVETFLNLSVVPSNPQ